MYTYRKIIHIEWVKAFIYEDICKCICIYKIKSNKKISTMWNLQTNHSLEFYLKKNELQYRAEVVDP